VDYEPVPIVPRPTGDESHELDMSLCYLRSMSPVHLQYLRNMGVTATLVVSLVRSGELWGLIACHHYTPRNIPFPIRAGCELLAEMITTRITALESYAQAQAEVAVRRIEHRMIQATSADGDFRRALFDDPRTLLRPMNATGAALVYQGEIRTTGEVPSTPDLRRLVEWIARSTDEPLFQTSRLTDLDSELAPLASTASGVLSMEISRAAREYVLWFRKEQVRTVSWAGDPRKPVVVGDDPKELSPRRSFAVWKEQVRGTSKPWSNAEVAFARTLGASLVDLVVQVRGVRVLIVESQLERLRRDVALSPTPILVVDPEGAILLENDAFANLFRRPRPQLRHMAGIPSLFTEPERARQVLRARVEERRSWSGQLRLRVDESEEIASSLPMLLRAHPVPGEGNEVLGYVLLLTDLRGRQEAEIARRRLRQAIVGVHPPTLLGESMTSEQRRQEALLQAILTNADVASGEVGDGAPPPLMTSLLRDVRASTRRAAHLSDEIQRYWRAEPERAEEGSGGGS
ncbi:MAG: GAF domain-containing protein, partial [Gemmatimonadota bacterium]